MQGKSLQCLRYVRSGLLAVAALWMGRDCRADIIVVPISGQSDGGHNFSPVFDTRAMSLQWAYSSSLLSSLAPGTQITGIAFRRSASDNITSNDYTYANWDLTVSKSDRPAGGLSTHFATNQDADAVTVYGSVPPDTVNNSDSLTVIQSSYAHGTAPRAWGPEIVFNTPYTYTGGDLLFSLQHSSGASSLGIDSIAGTTGTANSIIAVSNATATDGTSNSLLPVAELFVSSPEPATLGLVAPALALMLPRRRARSRGK